METRLLGMARTELGKAQEQMLLLGRKTAIERMSSFLLMLLKRTSSSSGSSNRVPIPMSRNDIGDYLGLTTETVSRTLTRLKTAGVITDTTDHRTLGVDVYALQDIADGF